MLDKKTKICIVGLGLMGGSYAEALSSKGFEVGGVDCNAKSVEYALEKGFIKHGTQNPDFEYMSGFDLVIFALYPHIFIKWIEENQKMLKSGAVISDVTGVKCGVVDEIQKILRSDVEFIASHPMAGREVYGIENASKEIFEGTNFIVTPTERNTEGAIEICKALGAELGFKNVTELTCEKHDEMIAFLSQLTHCIAVSLMTCKSSGNYAVYSGDSFRDLTRIAKINDEMWSELFLMNREKLLSQMDAFVGTVEDMRKCIADGNVAKLRKIMKTSTERRAEFDGKEDK